ncbi:hypothetical protein [Psychrobacter sp. I-STPA6b]|uniref:hypothetical protein n=1 Tax=Psychrobacter sp. I-STPA6b TaxID=2585718 RepID=UPI001D0CA347|nr:hypothetical protein [Psychrobacter sp. I-STPA6b]
MKATDKYRQIFGSIDHLKQYIPWTTGLSNMVEFIAWTPQSILGITKSQYQRQIIEWATMPEMRGKSSEQIEAIIKKKLQHQMEATEQLQTYSKKTTGICSVREALRRVKFFSEDYLNKEFDIFLSLCSDKYLDVFYSQFVDITKGYAWATHGNSGIFECSTKLKAMFMDNLAYNHDATILVANELKLNGKKNPDQILKYSFMYHYLVEKQFIHSDAGFLLLFIGSQPMQINQEEMVEKELAYCQKNPIKYANLLTEDIISIANNLTIASITWQEFIAFNESYLADNELCQVERKLLAGFNHSLQSKSFMYG